MALTVTLDMPKAERISRNLHMVSGVIAFDTSYPTGGELLTDISKHFITMLRLVCDQKNGYLFEFDKTDNKVIVYQTLDAVAGTRNQVANEGDLAALTGVSFIAVGLK